MSVGCVIPAAGRGERLGGQTPKAFRKLAGATLLEHAVRSVSRSSAVQWIVVASPAGMEDRTRALVDGIDRRCDVDVVTGGRTRSESVSAALAALPGACRTVLIHDAARPLVPTELVDSVVAACRSGLPAVIPVLLVTDTIKRVDEAGRVVETVDRDHLRAAQTPQGFDRSALQLALNDHPISFTDESGLMEAAGFDVVAIPGHAEAMKITRPFDITVAEAILRRRHLESSR